MAKKLRKNPAALIAAILILLSGFLFQLFHASIFGESLPSKKLSMINYLINLFNGPINFGSSEVLFGFIISILYIGIFLLYFLNGFGLIYNRHSRYASFLTFIYLVAGLIIYTILNQNSTSFFGVEIEAVNLGLGIYFIPLVGLCYLLFKKSINSAIRF